MYQKQLIAIAKDIIASVSVQEEIQGAKLLSDFFSKFNIHEAGILQEEKQMETIVSGGVALSPLGAAICLDDYLRTTRFIKGTYLAIKELLLKFPSQKINILYAGCGPYATVLLPLLPLLNKEAIDVILLDINEYSVQSVKELIFKLELADYDVCVLRGDAISYKHPKSKPLHLLITETMFRALIREPQVAITANLAPQLCPDGILLPEEIELSMGYSFFTKEPFLHGGEQSFTIFKKETLSYPDRLKSDTLFSMNKNDNFSDETSYNPYQFESGFYELPKEFNQYPDICIFTSIRIFKDLQLNSAESYITNPYCVTSLFSLTGYTHVQLVYDFKDIPAWSYEVKG